jgi:hypothetical protein
MVKNCNSIGPRPTAADTFGAFCRYVTWKPMAS